MPSFVLLWNPDRAGWRPADFEEAVRRTQAGERVAADWSVNRRRGIGQGDQVYMLRTRRDRGVVASGTLTSEPFEAKSWADPNKTAFYCTLEWDFVVAPEDRLPIETIKAAIPDVNWDHLQTSGAKLPEPAAKELARLWADSSLLPLPEEVVEVPGGVPEGAITQVTVNRYERNRLARQQCLDHWGYRCSVCGFDFEERYGDIGRLYIEVHHLVPISEVGEEYVVSPIKDLRPVCPNCHAMVHRTDPPLTIGQLRERLRDSDG